MKKEETALKHQQKYIDALKRKKYRAREGKREKEGKATERDLRRLQQLDGRGAPV